MGAKTFYAVQLWKNEIDGGNFVFRSEQKCHCERWALAVAPQKSLEQNGLIFKNECMGNRNIYKHHTHIYLMAETDKDIVLDTTEVLELTRNTRGYNWRIKLKEINIEKLNEINNKMFAIYGKEGEHE